VIVYNKLIRDKIPQIIESKGKRAEVRVMDSDEYTKMLNVKLQEELDEYKEANDESDQIAELADLVEVVYAILDNKGLSISEFEKVRLAKQSERGGFKDRLLLVKVE
jgi:predicted house-cleaning noncanonical NTP pyrophosphatase (MazG superfamily)